MRLAGALSIVLVAAIVGLVLWLVDVPSSAEPHTSRVDPAPDPEQGAPSPRDSEPPLRVLYVESFPRWEYRGLKDLLIRGEEFLAQAYLTEATGGFPQEASPSLESLVALPSTVAELRAYDVVIVGDVRPEAFEAALDEYVRGGGGLVFIAGDRGWPPSEALQDLLPVTLGHSPPLDESGHRMRLTAEGKEAGWLHPSEELLFWMADVKEVLSPATVLARIGGHAAIVESQRGRGRILFMANAGTWRWFAWQGPWSHHRFWIEVLRHMAGR